MGIVYSTYLEGSKSYLITGIMYRCFDLLTSMSRASRKLFVLDHGWESNPRHSHFQNDALPSELQGHFGNDVNPVIQELAVTAPVVGLYSSVG